MNDELRPAARALHLLHVLLTPVERRELVRILSASDALATLWMQVEPMAREPIPGPRVPVLASPPVVPPELEPMVAAEERRLLQEMVREGQTQSALVGLGSGFV